MSDKTSEKEQSITSIVNLLDTDQDGSTESGCCGGSCQA